MPYFLEGLAAFVAYFALGAILLSVTTAIYMRLTAHNEIALVRQGNMAAAIALGGTIIAISLPISSAISNTMAIVAALTWSVIGCVVQLAAYAFARLLMPDLSKKIEEDDRTSAILLAAISIAAGMLNAACMTY